MFGKLFASCYEGSMHGAGAVVFALWPYALARCAPDGVVELFPGKVCADLGITMDQFREGIGYLQAPDPMSRNQEEEGRRLINVGAFSWRIVSHAHYRAIQTADGHREYMREAQRRSRDRSKASKPEKKNKKREVEVIGKPRLAKWTRVPADWAPNGDHAVLAASLGVDMLAEQDKFKDHEFKAPKTDADAAFRTWLRNAGQYSRASTPRAQGRPMTAQERQAEKARRTLAEEAAAQGGAR